MSYVKPWVRRSLLVVACLALTGSFGCGGSAPAGSWSPNSRSEDGSEPAPEVYIEPEYREPVADTTVLEEPDPWIYPDDAEPAPADEGPIDEPVPDPYVEGPIDEPVPDPYVEDPGSEAPIDEPVPDPYVEGPIDEPVSDPYVEDEPYIEGPIDEPVPDPYVEGPIDEPVPDPYVEDEPYIEGPIDEPVPDPYVEGPIDEPVPDPYVEAEPYIEYESVLPIHAERGPARLVDADDDGSFRRWGPAIHRGGMRFEYQARYQPGHLRGSAYHAVARAFGTWERESGQRLFNLAFVGGGTRGPKRDGRNVVCWRTFTGPGAALPAVVFVWDNGSDIVEADIVLNARRAFGIAAEIQPGEQRVLQNMLFDLQSVVTHEIGHVLGLADRHEEGSEGSTMHAALRMREVRAQTLSRGDRNGLAKLLQRARPTRPKRGNPRTGAGG